MRRIIVDLDNTITIDDPNTPYENKTPNIPIINKLTDYKNANWEIIIFTSRNMNTYKGDVEVIKKNTIPIIIKWLTEHKVPYDEVIIGKPWPGKDGFYIDDKSIRPDEFLNLTSKQISHLLKK